MIPRRRAALATALAVLPVAVLARRGEATPPASPNPPVAHNPSNSNPLGAPQDPTIDWVVAHFMQGRGFPGGALAVMKDGKLIHVQTFGECDTAMGPVATSSRFRIASLSKSITGAAIAKLVSEGKIKLDAPISSYVEPIEKELPKPPANSPLAKNWKPDPLTVRRIIHMTSGFDNKVYDPMWDNATIAAAQHVNRPAQPVDIVKYMRAKGTAHTPGAEYHYANYNYFLLGRAIEHVTGMSYEAYCQQEILAPLGIFGMTLGKTLEADKARNEVHYFTSSGAPQNATSVFSQGPQSLPWPYGGFYLESMGAHGGWIATVVDLARWVNALSPTATQPWIRDMFKDDGEVPIPTPGSGTDITFYGYGIRVTTDAAHQWKNLSHGGSMPGTLCAIARHAPTGTFAPGVAWAAIFNQRSSDDPAYKIPPDGSEDDSLDSKIDVTLNKVPAWPTQDFFPQYP